MHRGKTWTSNVISMDCELLGVVLHHVYVHRMSIVYPILVRFTEKQQEEIQDVMKYEKELQTSQGKLHQVKIVSHHLPQNMYIYIHTYIHSIVA